MFPAKQQGTPEPPVSLSTLFETPVLNNSVFWPQGHKRPHAILAGEHLFATPCLLLGQQVCQPPHQIDLKLYHAKAKTNKL